MDSRLDPGFLKGLYATMLRIRRCEEAFVEPIVSREVRCPVHLYSGEEAVAAGVCAGLRREDYVFGTHRSHGHYLAKGGDLRRMVAEIFCRETGCAGGRGGSMHVVDPAVGMLGAAPIVSGTISLAVGAGLAAAAKGDGRVSVCFFGDGATGEGTLFESLNLAALRRLPVLFVCENNLYSTHLPIREIRASGDIWKVAEPFGLRTARVDGNDVLAVWQKATEFIEGCRKGEGPAFLECLTYRLRGHVGPDDNLQGSRTDIRPREEVQAWREKDPIPRFRRILEGAGVVDEAAIDAIHESVEREVADAFADARNARFPEPERLADDVFC